MKKRLLSLLICTLLLCTLVLPSLPVAAAPQYVVDMLTTPGSYSYNTAKMAFADNGSSVTLQNLSIDTGATVGWPSVKRTFTNAIEIDITKTPYLYLDVDVESTYTVHSWNIGITDSDGKSYDLAGAFGYNIGSQIPTGGRFVFDLSSDAVLTYKSGNDVISLFPSGTTKVSIKAITLFCVCEKYTTVTYNQIYFADAPREADVETNPYLDPSTAAFVNIPTASLPTNAVNTEPPHGDYWLDIDDYGYYNGIVYFNYHGPDGCDPELMDILVNGQDSLVGDQPAAGIYYRGYMLDTTALPDGQHTLELWYNGDHVDTWHINVNNATDHDGTRLSPEIIQSSLAGGTLTVGLNPHITDDAYRVEYYQAPALPVTATITNDDGETAMTAQQLAVLAAFGGAVDGSVNETRPLHTFTVDVTDVSGDVIVSYDGETQEGESLLLELYNPAAGTWEAKARALSGLTASFAVNAADYADDNNLLVRASVELVDNGSDTFIWVTDTQFYTHYTDITQNYFNITQYAADEYQSGNIGYVVHTGDLVDIITDIANWQVADAAQRILDNAGVPNGVVSGNHDVGNPSTASGMVSGGNYDTYAEYFGASRYNKAPWFGGAFTDINEHHYDLVTIGGQDFVFLYLGLGRFMDPAALAWADEVLTTYSHRNAVICTHMFLSYSNELYTMNSVPAGQLLLDNYIKPYDNVVLLLCGHEDGNATSFFTNNAGKQVLTMMNNYQFTDVTDSNWSTGSMKHANGDGFIRLMTINDSTLSFTTYSPTWGTEWPNTPYAPQLDIGSYDLALQSPARTLKTNNFSAVAADTLTEAKTEVYPAGTLTVTESFAAIEGQRWLSFITNMATDAQIYTPAIAQIDTSVAIIVTAGTGGTASGGGTYEYSETVTLTATANSGYAFDGWYENNTKVAGAGRVYSFAATTNRTLQARFTVKDDNPVIIITENEFTVRFNSQGGSAVADQVVAENGTATKPTDPTLEHYSFVGWYTEAACVNAFDFATPITADITLYAKWKENPSEWAKKEVDDAIKNNLVPEDLQKNYKDPISRIDFCRLAIQFLTVVEFDFDAYLGDAPAAQAPYDDCDDADVMLATQLGIVVGVGHNQFEPDRDIRRDEAARMLALTCAVLGKYNENAPQTEYADQDQIHRWARAEINFMYEINVMTGTTGERFAPLDPYTVETAIVTFQRLFVWLNG